MWRRRRDIIARPGSTFALWEPPLTERTGEHGAPLRRSATADAAGLLAALGAAPAVTFGTSSGGVFALCLLVRHPDAARGAILHEPGLLAFHDDPDAARAPLKAALADAMAQGGRVRPAAGTACAIG